MPAIVVDPVDCPSGFSSTSFIPTPIAKDNGSRNELSTTVADQTTKILVGSNTTQAVLFKEGDVGGEVSYSYFTD